jgi:hypothetical protein
MEKDPARDGITFFQQKNADMYVWADAKVSPARGAHAAYEVLWYDASSTEPVSAKFDREEDAEKFYFLMCDVKAKILISGRTISKTSEPGGGSLVEKLSQKLTAHEDLTN